MMQAVILAAGKGTRCRPLTETHPKPLIKIANQTILEHNLNQLQGIVKEAIIVVGYKAGMIKKSIGKRYKKIKITYIQQKTQNGTGGALRLCESKIKNRFILMNGDDLYSKEDIKNCIKEKYAVLTKKVPDPEKWGIVETKNGFITRIKEKPKKTTSNQANVGLCVWDKSIFKHILKKSTRGDYEATDYITHTIKKGEKVKAILVKDYWIPVGYPWHILDANEQLLKRIKTSIKGKVEKGVVIKGKAIIGKGTIIKSGTYLEGPVIIGENCIIGPNTFIRGSTSIGDNCQLTNGTEVKNSILGENTFAKHLSYICDSILGNNINLGAGTIIANLRFDGKEVKIIVNNKRISTGRKKLGAIIGDNVQTGINVSIMPGIKIKAQTTIFPGKVIKRDQ